MKQFTGGFTLIEVMVGVVIALISIVVMFQVQENWDRQRSSIVSGGDAQVAGAISAFQLERDLRNAGSGFGNSNYLGCNVSAHDVVDNRDFNFTLSPVLITDGTPTDPDAPDTVAVLRGNSSTPTSTYQVAATTTSETNLRDVRTGVNLGDLVIISEPATPSCRLAEITVLGPTSGTDNGRAVGHTTTAYTRNTRPPENRLNSPAGACSAAGSAWSCNVRFNPVVLATDYAASATQFGELRSLGDDPRLNVWSVDTARSVLTMAETIRGVAATDMGDSVVDLQAEYGLDTNGDDVVDVWQAAAPAAWDQIRSVRFAMLARGQHFERVAVTINAPTWAGGAFVMRNLDGTADSGAAALGINNWRNYRYSVFEVTVPLRNMIWRRFW